MAFKFYKQLNSMDCGPTCIRMVAKYHGKHFADETLRQAGFDKSEVSLLGGQYSKGSISHQVNKKAS